MSELRDTIAEAWPDEEEALEAEETSSEIVEEDNEPQENAAEEIETEEKTADEPISPGGKNGGKTGEKETAEITPPVEAAKAPASWSPKARETWGKLPSEAQAQVIKREKEVNEVLQQSATARQAANQLNQTLAPFREGLIANGVQDPFQAIGGLLQAEQTLRTGSQQNKAQQVARLIQQYGVDIGTLDDVLSGQSGYQTAPETSQFEQLLEQRLAPMQQFLQQQQYQQQQNELNEQYQAQQTVQTFSQNAEFLPDVRNDMADLLDMASKRGQVMTIEDAYKKACTIHPEVSQILSQRAQQQKIMGNNQSIAAKKTAASASITGLQGGAGGKPEAGSMRDAIANAWAAHTGEI